MPPLRRSRYRRECNSPIHIGYFTNPIQPTSPATPLTPRFATRNRRPSSSLSRASVRIGVHHRQAERALAEEFEALVAVERMVQAGAHVPV